MTAQQVIRVILAMRKDPFPGSRVMVRLTTSGMPLSSAVFRPLAGIGSASTAALQASDYKDLQMGRVVAIVINRLQSPHWRSSLPTSVGIAIKTRKIGR